MERGQQVNTSKYGHRDGDMGWLAMTGDSIEQKLSIQICFRYPDILVNTTNPITSGNKTHLQMVDSGAGGMREEWSHQVPRRACVPSQRGLVNC